ncbi:MAG: dual specificity protein phosphatase family protein [Promethearchaeota archaeon]
MRNNKFITWVIPGKLARSPFPLFQELSTLVELNIFLVINLTSQGIPNRLGNQLRASGIRIKRLPIPDFGTPNQNTINQYLQMVCETILQNQAVLTHCIAGCGRTGTMIGLFLITHGYSPLVTLETIHKILGKGCPETEEQIDLLKQYRKKCPNFRQCNGKISA